MIRDKAVQSLRGEVCKVRSAAVSRNGGLTMHVLSSSQSLGNGTWAYPTVEFPTLLIYSLLIYHSLCAGFRGGGFFAASTRSDWSFGSYMISNLRSLR